MPAGPVLPEIMARIPLEDNFTDIIAKAQCGLRISDEQLAAHAEVSIADLSAVKGGKPLYAVIRRVARHLRLGPDALEASARHAWYPEQVLFPRGFAMFNTPYGDMTVNSYLIWDSRTRIAAAFDTGASCAAMVDVMRAERLDLQHIFITHTHEDHIVALPELAAAAGAAVWSSEREPLDFPHARTFKENAHFHLGDGIAIKTLLVSGHTPGLTAYYITGLAWPLAIVGDAVFAGSMGGSAAHYGEQHRNNFGKIFSLPKDTVLAPGHGPLSTLAQEKKHNPFFAR